eukprot:TRINITY_DN89788_c0_g1_i1.p1 TRINITY_DN89788_c0_g1~~TRINITY_DN89788_c0_g1_i1.p1  ORF type:complete len:571 (-),score=86.49 TRINITY_DN89788_c0_g1_i1:134-1846(-)
MLMCSDIRKQTRHETSPLGAGSPHGAMSSKARPVMTALAGEIIVGETMRNILERLESIENLQKLCREEATSLHQASQQKLEGLVSELRRPGASRQARFPEGVGEMSENFLRAPQPPMVCQRSTVKSPHTGSDLRNTGKSKSIRKSMNAIMQPQSSLTLELDGAKNDGSNMVKRVRWFWSSGRAEAILGPVILLNLALMFVEFQLSGSAAGHILGKTPDEGAWPQAESVFAILENVFNVVYLLDLCVRVVLLGPPRELVQILDTFSVLACVAENFIMQPMGLNAPALTCVRLLRIIRILRAITVVKFLKMGPLENLRIIVRTLASTIDDLLWSCTLLALMITSAGMLMVKLTEAFILDADQDLEMRLWCFNRFGTSMRATYTVFEATFTGTWTASARPLIERVDPMFTLFWGPYVLLVNFAMIRVIAAMFLKQTLAVANNDQETKARENMAKKETFSNQLRMIFEVADTSGDGCINLEEFEIMTNDAKVVSLFQEMGLAINDVYALFMILADDDGQADYDEFLTGAMDMKSQASNLDVIVLKHEIRSVMRRIDRHGEALDYIMTGMASEHS